MSDYEYWDQLDHAEDYITFPENIGSYLIIDEISLSQGEQYTMITYKGTKGCFVAIIKGTDSEPIKSFLAYKLNSLRETATSQSGNS